MIIIEKIIKVIDTINEKISKFASLFMFALILTLTYEVFSRYGLGRPTQWSFDLTYFLTSFVLMLSMAYTWKCNEHVAVDLISSRLPRRLTALIFVIFILALFFVCWINISRVMSVDLIRSWTIKQKSTIGSNPPVYPYKTWIFTGVLMLVLQGVSQFLKELIVLVKGGDEA